MKKNKLNCGIYKIENITNNECYIGQSKNLCQRKSTHFSSLRMNKSRHKLLQKAWNKYGENNFVFKVLLYCEKKDLKYYEDSLIEKINPIYNSPFLYVGYENKDAYISYCRYKYPCYYKKFKQKCDFYNNDEYNYYKIMGLRPNNITKMKHEHISRFKIFNFIYPDQVEIEIYMSELDKIENIENIKVKKILFLMLALSKYYYAIGENNKFLVKHNMDDIFSFAKIYICNQDREDVTRQILSTNLITKIDNFYEINFVDNEGYYKIKIKDMMKTMDYFYFDKMCQKCEWRIISKKNIYKFCSVCWNEEKKQRKKRAEWRNDFYYLRYGLKFKLPWDYKNEPSTFL
jgi:group I intron endonuclease